MDGYKPSFAMKTMGTICPCAPLIAERRRCSTALGSHAQTLHHFPAKRTAAKALQSQPIKAQPSAHPKTNHPPTSKDPQSPYLQRFTSLSARLANGQLIPRHFRKLQQPALITLNRHPTPPTPHQPPHHPVSRPESATNEGSKTRS